MLKVKDILETKDNNIWSISRRATVYEALQIIAAKDIEALLVIERGCVIGIFSERDYARKVILKGKSSRETSVGELMTSQVYSITPDKTIKECMALMTETRSRHLPVFENNQLIGIVSIGDVVNLLMEKKVF